VAFYTSPEIIAARAKLLDDIAQELIAKGILQTDRIVYRGGRVPLAANAYFILNLAYKALRLPGGHNTEIPKIAALQCVAIATFQPFRPLHKTNVRDVYEYRSSEIFALTYAFGILEIDFKPNTPEKKDLWLRLLDIIAAASSETLQAYVTDIEYKLVTSLEDYNHRVLLEADKLPINSLISIFELLSKKRNRIFGIIPWHTSAWNGCKNLFKSKK